MARSDERSELTEFDHQCGIYSTNSVCNRSSSYGLRIEQVNQRVVGFSLDIWNIYIRTNVRNCNWARQQNYKQRLVSIEERNISGEESISLFVEGNRREGRRPSYAFEYSSPPQIMPPPPPPPPATTAPGSVFLSSPVAHRSRKRKNTEPLAALTRPSFVFAVDSNHAAMAAALSHPFFLAAAAASSRDMSESLSNTPRMSASSFDEHHPLISSTAMKRSMSPSCHSKCSDDGPKKFSPAMNNHHIGRSPCFTPTMNTSSLLSQVSKLKMIAKGKRASNLLVSIRWKFFFDVLENNHEQTSLDRSITLSIELNGTAYQGTLYATTLTGSKEWIGSVVFMYLETRHLRSIFLCLSVCLLSRFVRRCLFLTRSGWNEISLFCAYN